LASPQSLRRIARLAQKLEQDLRTGGMAYPWKALFRTNAILTRVVAHLAEHLASEAEGASKAEGASEAEGKAGRPREHLPRRTRATADAERGE